MNSFLLLFIFLLIVNLIILENVQNYVISGCVVFQNGRGFNLLGNDYSKDEFIFFFSSLFIFYFKVITNNVCSQNNSPNNFGGGSTKIVMNNVDC